MFLLNFITLAVVSREDLVLALEPGDSKIIGGREIEDNSLYPFMVKVRSHQGHLCGGVLLSTSHVLTACHCFYGICSSTVPSCDATQAFEIPPDETKRKKYTDWWYFVAGVVTLDDPKNEGQTRNAKELLHHPKCGRIHGQIVNDLAVAEVNTPFKPTVRGSVKPIGLPDTSPSEFKRKLNKIMTVHKPPCEVLGWGLIAKHYSHYSDTLKVVTMEIADSDVCAEDLNLYPQNYKNPPLYFNLRRHHQICAKSEYSNESDCSGDAGGPLLCGGNLLALVSYGGCASTLKPNVYQLITPFLSWVANDPRLDSLAKILGIDVPTESQRPLPDDTPATVYSGGTPLSPGLSILALVLLLTINSQVFLTKLMRQNNN